MNALVIGFFGEGSCEYNFLMPLVQRVLESLIPTFAVLATPFSDLRVSDLSQPEKILRVAREAAGYHLVIFHLDADGSTAERAYQERFKPGFEALAEYPEKVNRDIVPVIPIRMTEAWLLVDFDAFRRVVGTGLTMNDLDFPTRPEDVEKISDPKAKLASAIRIARGKRRPVPVAEVYEPIARVISLELLSKVPAYQVFVDALRDKLTELHYL